MDDALEQPTAVTEKAPNASASNADEDHVSDEEDGQGLDWTRIQPKTGGAARPVIPKRGEKEFEPNEGGGSGLQIHILDRARQAMFNTLRTVRTTSSKAISYAVWYPDIARSHVVVAKGVHFTSMGHSAPRFTDTDDIEKQQKRLELLPEETIYLVERGSLLCYKDWSSRVHESGLDHLAGSPMTVQQVYSEMVGKEDITLERLQVYTYLRRLGYAVMRANPPDPYYPTPQPLRATKELSNPKFYSFLNPCSCLSWFKATFSSIWFDWWHPIRIRRWLPHNKSYTAIFQSMRVTMADRRGQPRAQDPTPSLSSPYQIFYNVYKPTTGLKKSSPGPPDFQVVVVNARTTPMPTLFELESLFSVVPELPPPAPRQRPQPTNHPKPPSNEASKKQNEVAITFVPSGAPLFARLFPWLFLSKSAGVSQNEPPRRPNPFGALKAGKKMVVIAAVDNGNISFFRFGQGVFADWPMA
ncbi:hypothetical protein AX16_001754 [Volvariella volvacea WC 439]|nr:hypothetical protein AX16_001754 [Volvariella volvacea WC 439]